MASAILGSAAAVFGASGSPALAAAPSPVVASSATAGFTPLPDGRGYWLAGALTRSASRPLVLALHGWRLTPQDMAGVDGLDGYGSAHGFTIVHGAGLNASWNAGACCGTSAAEQTDDVGYLVRVVDDVAARVPIDRSRVYVVGFSNGGMLAERAVCDRPDVFAAAGWVAGTLVTTCRTGAPKIM